MNQALQSLVAQSSSRSVQQAADTQRLLITGGSGYLGSEVRRLAVASGQWEVIATYHSRRPSHPGAHYIPFDVRDPLDVEHICQVLQPAVIIHTAYLQNGPELWAVTAEGAATIARAAQLVNARLIHLSSDVIFDGERVGAYTEEDQPSPISAYGQAKAAAEQLVAQACPGALIARTSLIYGGHEPSKHEQLVFDAADRRQDIAFFTDEIRCPVQVGDLAQALLELARLDVAGILHLAGADAVSRYEFAQLVAAAYDRPTTWLRSALSAHNATPRPRFCALDSSRARRLLATPLRGVREVLRQPPGS